MVTAGNRLTLYGADDAPLSSSLFTVFETSDEAAADQALEWLSKPIRERRFSYFQDQVQTNLARLNARLGPDLPARKMSNGGGTVPLSDYFDHYLQRERSCLIADGVPRKGVLSDALTHSFDLGVFCPSTTQFLLQLLSMGPQYRSELIRWLTALWWGNPDGTTLPGQVVSAWTFPSSFAPLLRYIFEQETGVKLPVVAVPWTQEPREAKIGRESKEPSDGDWREWITELLDLREQGFRVFSESGANKRYRESLCSPKGFGSECAQFVNEVIRRFAVLFATSEIEGFVRTANLERTHIERAHRLTVWLTRQQCQWSWRNIVPHPDLDVGPPLLEDEFLDRLAETTTITPDRVYRIERKLEEFTAEDIRECAELWKKTRMEMKG